MVSVDVVPITPTAENAQYHLDDCRLRTASPMKVTIPDCVLSTDLQDEGVLLNLETGEYFGLDAVALDMWKALGACGSVEAARSVLLEQYEVTEDVLGRDLDELVGQLVERKLVRLEDDEPLA